MIFACAEDVKIFSVTIIRKSQDGPNLGDKLSSDLKKCISIKVSF